GWVVGGGRWVVEDRRQPLALLLTTNHQSATTRERRGPRARAGVPIKHASRGPSPSGRRGGTSARIMLASSRLKCYERSFRVAGQEKEGREPSGARPPRPEVTGLHPKKPRCTGLRWLVRCFEEKSPQPSPVHRASTTRIDPSLQGEAARGRGLHASPR